MVNIDAKTLEYMYVNQHKSRNHIAVELGCARGTVSRYLKKYGIKKRQHNCTNNLCQQSFGLLMAREYHSGKGWLCTCKCGNSIYVQTHHLKQGRTRSCGCRRHLSGSDSPRWKGHKEISSSYVTSLKHGAIRREIVFDITIQYMWDVYTKQQGRCSISGVELSFPDCASLDRIDSMHGYITDNVQWLHPRVNQMKWDNNQEEFIEWCKIIAENG